MTHRGPFQPLLFCGESSDASPIENIEQNPFLNVLCIAFVELGQTFAFFSLCINIPK